MADAIAKKASKNVYEKLQEVRYALSKADLTKTGNNAHLKSKYFEIADFLPAITKLMHEHKLFSSISFSTNRAVLTVINSETPDEKIHFTSPMSTAELRNCHAVQNLGCVQTYLRRYLYTTAFEIIESDTLDGTITKEPLKKVSTPANNYKSSNGAAKNEPKPAGIPDDCSKCSEKVYKSKFPGDTHYYCSGCKEKYYPKKEEKPDGKLTVEDKNSGEEFANEDIPF